MAVYFVTEQGAQGLEPLNVKVGYSSDLKRRTGQLQTGNPRKLVLMGQIKDAGSAEGRQLEKKLHRRLARFRTDQGEWFHMEPKDVLDVLKSCSSQAYISVGPEPFEIVSFDRDGVPEFASPWDWGDVEADTFCPACGWAGGWTYNENWAGMFCLECGASEHDFATDQ